MSFNPNPPSLPPNKEDRTQVLNATLSFLSSNPSIKTHSLQGNLLANLLNTSPVAFPMNSSDNKPPALTPWFSRFKKTDPLADRQNGIENSPIKPLEMTLGLNNMLLPINKNSISPVEESFTRLKDENIKSHDVDFWLVFEKKQIKMKVENFLEDLKNQFESINIVKIRQFYYLEKKDSDLLVTGWKLFDETLVYDIINQTKKLLLTSSNQKLDFQIIQSAADLRKHLRKIALDQKLEQLGLFTGEFAKPLFKLQMQGLAYYEFDYVDLCPETLCILCGLPPSTTDAEILDCFTHHVLPKPINILRNPTSEGQTTVRVSFADRSAADLLRFQGLKVPVEGEFNFKPLIIIPIKSRNFDYLSELIKFQVKIDFEMTSKPDTIDLIKYMKELEVRYGTISDVNMIGSTECIVSFAQISSALKCLDTAKFEEFSLKAVISKPSHSYPCAGYLFQSEIENAKNDISIQRPPPLVKTDPAQLRIPSKFFEKKLNLKKRYQKIYLAQQEEARKKSSQNLEKVEENSPSFSDFKYEQLLTEGVTHETDHLTCTKPIKPEEISNLIETTQKTAMELIAEISKPSSLNIKRPLSPAVDEEEEEDVPEPEIESEDDDSFEDFHIKILQPITDDLDFNTHHTKVEEHDQSTEVEQNDSKLIEKASKPTKKLKTESRVSPKNKLEKSRSSSINKGASSRTGKYIKKAVVVSQKMQVEDTNFENHPPVIQPKRSERLALKADPRKSKIYASLLKNKHKKKDKEIKQKRKALAKTKKRTHNKRGPIEDNLYTRESPLINFMMNNFVKNEEEHKEEEMNIKNEDIRNIKIEVKKELIEEEFGLTVEIEVPDMKALFLPRELRQVKVVSSRYMMKRPKQFKFSKQSEAKRAAEIEDKTKLLIQQNIEKIRNLIEINQDIRRKKQADDKETKVKFEE